MNDKNYTKFVNKKNINNKGRNLFLKLEPNYMPIQITNINTRNYSNKNSNLTNTYSQKIKMFHNYMQNKARLRFPPGMFSYKRNINHNLNNSYGSKNESNKFYSNNQNNIFFPNKKLQNENTETSSFRTLTNNDNNISNNFLSISSLNINKLRILNEANYKNRSFDMGNTFNNTNFKYDFLKYNNIIINNIQQPKMRSRSNNIIYINSKKSSKNNSIQYSNKNVNNIINEKEIKIKNYFIGKTKGENESRRMIVEYLKVLKQKENNKSKISNILKNNNISYKVLNQQNIFNNINNYTNKSLSNSYVSNYFKKIESPKKKINFKNIKKFLNDMDDASKDKINMVKFLSVPKIMELIFFENSHKYIFILVPNQLSFKKGIESYIFKWNDIKTGKYIGGFDLIKVTSCYLNSKKDKNVLIETFDGVFHRQYELVTSSKEIASYYVKSINYLSRLEKCKIYNNKYLCD